MGKHEIPYLFRNDSALLDVLVSLELNDALFGFAAEYAIDFKRNVIFNNLESFLLSLRFLGIAEYRIMPHQIEQVLELYHFLIWLLEHILIWYLFQLLCQFGRTGELLRRRFEVVSD
jgi:hypothetical protein